MTRILPLIIAALISVTVYGQVETISPQDSILLKKFWTQLKVAINAKDKAKIATLCDFPFYCRPCLHYVKQNDDDLETVKVTKALFNESLYKVFLEKSLKDDLNSIKDFHTWLFRYSYDSDGKPVDLGFIYTLVAPSKTWEGLQGLIYVHKVKGEYKINGIDTVP